jgi:hypothetical protein
MVVVTLGVVLDKKPRTRQQRVVDLCQKEPRNYLLYMVGRLAFTSHGRHELITG